MRSLIYLGLIIGCVFTVGVIICGTLSDESNTYSSIPKPQSNDVKKRLKHDELANIDSLMTVDKSLYRKKNVMFETEVVHNEVDGKESNVINGKDGNDWKISEPKSHPILQQMFVHLDLKGAPPLISYYEQIFPLFVKLGVTGLLVEYEDMFPYWASLRDLSALNSYSKQDVQQLVQLAKKNGLEIMPLIQTFGHMEFILKHSTFAHLREISYYPQVICPSQNDSFTLITTMIDQIVELHPKIKWLHIGADEVYYLGKCSVCQQKISTMNWSKDRLFLDHVKMIAIYIKSKYGIQPIMWDDMFRQMSEEEIRSSNIAKHVEIMAWSYRPDVLSELPPEVWFKYGNLFAGNIWVASAFKGATGPAKFITLISHHLENHNAWMDIIKTYNPRLRFRGIALTGWQRYDHFAVLCELLPVAFPCLTVNLLFLQMGTMEPELISKATHVMNCTLPISLEFDVSIIVRCNYPGARVYEGVQKLYNIQQEFIDTRRSNHISGWLNQYNIDTHFSSPALVEIANQKILKLKRKLTILRDDMERALSLIYDHYTVSEWLHLNLQPFEKKADNWLSGIQDLLNQNSWQRRPLSYNRTTCRASRYPVRNENECN